MQNNISDIIQRAHSIHKWELKPREAISLQIKLSEIVSEFDDPSLQKARMLAAFDVSSRPYSKKLYGSCVLWDLEKSKNVKVVTAVDEVSFPYIPGLLSFRETPLMIKLLEILGEVPDIILCDAHGKIHPRFFGLACHIGVATDIPSIGCAKNPFVGKYEKLPIQKGSKCEVTFKGKKVGYALRTKAGSKPVFVSPGHKISCETAVKFVSMLIDKCRIPVPLRIAHNEAISTMRADNT